MVGTNISHYEIVEKLGEGGMGAVYKAHDLTLGRFVALKVLTAAIRDSADHRSRFLQEARAASALNHPNIITIHDILPGVDDRGDSIVMEFVRGKTLDDVITEGLLPVANCLKLAMQIADALAAAHGIGIVHRDLKPANVMVTPEGLAKVLDFGLAKLAAGGNTGAGVTRFPGLGDNDQTLSIHTGSLARARPRTAEGSIVGTIAYMSPEQAEGRAVDTRSDIFSFGAVLYEMLSGQRAFHGTSSLAVLAAVLRDTPRDLSALRPEVPAAVQEAIASCLQKDVDLRCQSIADVRNELEKTYYMLRTASSVDMAVSAIVPSPAARALPSIAVLPFLNLSSDKENEYFSDGLAEEIINSLTRVENLRVAARTSAFAFRGTQTDVQQIGQTLRVASVLEGSVRKSGNRVRISVQLIDSEAGSNLWSERYDREMTDVFEIQDEISQNIVGKLRVKLAGHLEPNSAEASPDPVIKVKRFTDNMEAYNLYLKARHELYRMRRDNLTLAQSLFRGAIDLDPDYALAHEGLAYALFTEAILGFAAPHEAMPRARESVLRALELDDSVAEAHATFALILAVYDWDWAGAEREFRRSIALNESSPLSRDNYAFYYLRPVKRLAEARVQTQQALALDPLAVLTRVHLGFLFYAEKQFEQAAAQFQKALEIDANHFLTNALLGMTLTFHHDFEAALAHHRRAREADPDSKFAASLHAMTLGFAGRREEALELAAEVEKPTGKNYVSPVCLAWVCVSVGEYDRAFSLLTRACDERDSNLLGLLTNPIFDNVRNDTRFSSVLNRMGLRGGNSRII